jgi:hypothetical protein
MQWHFRFWKLHRWFGEVQSQSQDTIHVWLKIDAFCRRIDSPSWMIVKLQFLWYLPARLECNLKDSLRSHGIFVVVFPVLLLLPWSCASKCHQESVKVQRARSCVNWDVDIHMYNIYIMCMHMGLSSNRLTHFTPKSLVYRHILFN